MISLQDTASPISKQENSEGKRQATQNQALRFITKNGALVFLVFMIIFDSIFTNNFLNLQSFWNIINQMITLALIAFSMTFVISAGGIDISVGSVMAIAGIMVAALIPKIGLVPAILAAIAAGTAVGLFNGFIISTFNIQPMIVTLTMMITGRGIAKVIGGGNIIMSQDPNLSALSMSYIGGVPIQFFYLIIIFAIFLFIAKKTVLARYIEAVGDNCRASFLSGLKIKKLLLIIYGISGLMAGLAGILTVSFAGAADPDKIGLNYETYAIAAVVIGGTPMTGGKARMKGTLIGAFILQLITVTINMNNIPYAWSLVAETVIIILAVFVQNIKHEGI